MSNTAFNSNYVSTGGSTSPATQEFRLTLTSNTPVLTTGVTAATTLYLTPYKGNNIGLYSAGAWSVVSSAEVSLSLSGLLANTLYDIFAYKSGVTVVLEALAWTNSGAGTSARATALAYQDGILVKSGDATRRYIGTIRTVAAGQTEFSFGGAATEAKLFVANYYNEVLFSANVWPTVAGWTFTTSAGNFIRAANNDTGFRVSFISLNKNSFSSRYSTGISVQTATTNAQVAIGLNSTTSISGTTAYSNQSVSVGNFAQAVLEQTASAGFNFVQALDQGLSVGFTFNFGGTSNSGALIYKNGLFFQGWF